MGDPGAEQFLAVSPNGPGGSMTTGPEPQVKAGQDGGLLLISIIVILILIVFSIQN